MVLSIDDDDYYAGTAVSETVDDILQSTGKLPLVEGSLSMLVA